LHAEAEGEVTLGEQPLGQGFGEDRFHGGDGAPVEEIRQCRDPAVD
jgi:hypothetical protein